MTTVEEYLEIRKRPALWIRHMILRSPQLRSIAPIALNNLKIERDKSNPHLAKVTTLGLELTLTWNPNGDVFAEAIRRSTTGRIIESVFERFRMRPADAGRGYELYKFVCDRIRLAELSGDPLPFGGC